MKNVLLIALHDHGKGSLALGYLKSWLDRDPVIVRNYRVRIRVFPTSAEPCTVHGEIEALGSVAMVGFSVYSWNADAVEVLLRTLPDSVTAFLGGPDADGSAERWLREHDNVGFIIRGEGEIPLQLVLRAYLDDPDMSFLPGIPQTAVLKDGRFILNHDSAIVALLDRIPSPLLTGNLPLDNIVSLQFTRGCPYQCAYCLERVQPLRSHSIERMLAETRVVLRNPEVRHLSLANASFDPNSSHGRALAELFRKENHHGTDIVVLELRAEKVDESAVSVLEDLNVSSVETGPQTTNPEVLRNIRRSFHRERFARGVELLKHAGIHVDLDLILGLPGDDFYSFMRSLFFCLDLAPERINPFLLRLFPNSPLYAKRREFGYRAMERAPYAVVENNTFSAGDLRLARIVSKRLIDELRLAGCSENMFEVVRCDIDGRSEVENPGIGVDFREFGAISLRCMSANVAKQAIDVCDKAREAGISGLILSGNAIDFRLGAIPFSGFGTQDFDSDVHALLRRIDRIELDLNDSGLDANRIMDVAETILQLNTFTDREISLVLHLVADSGFENGILALESALSGKSLRDRCSGIAVAFSTEEYLRRWQHNPERLYELFRSASDMTAKAGLWAYAADFPPCLLPRLDPRHHLHFYTKSGRRNRVPAPVCQNCEVSILCRSFGPFANELRDRLRPFSEISPHMAKLCKIKRENNGDSSVLRQWEIPAIPA